MNDFIKRAIGVIGKKSSRFKDIRFSIIVVAVLIIGILSGATIKSNIEHKKYTEAYEVSLGEEKIGMVRDKQLVLNTYNHIKDNFKKESGFELLHNEEFTFQQTYAEDEELTSKTNIYNNIKNRVGESVLAYGLKVDGKLVGIVKSDKVAKNIIEDIKKPYIENSNENSKIEEVKILEDIKIEQVKVDVSQIQNSNDLINILKKGTNEEKTHIVKEGESFWEIASNNKITVEDLVKANPSLTPESIREGDEISLIAPKSYITVVTYETKTYTEEIPYEVKYEKSDSLYSNQKKVKQEGTEGKKEVVVKLEKRNGIEIAKEVISQTIKSQPIAQIITKGTKAIPSSRGTGQFSMPVNGRLTSSYGPRGSGFHSGIDLAASTGTTIRAADNGVVTFAGYSGSYGYMIKVDHGNGYATKYAHSSKLYVSKGQKVAKGQSIAAVGNTGRSTGPHLHFEVLVNGRHRNPYNYLR
ncbi:peptidoglycan DD-metalloendopeptidase family protein [Clostridium sp. D2Q-11]|uniref:Peptidoglycan DD-metalloendopeptidase family protein n=1 Tax=Anaeromonas frigoriresistens TaxID=2683708 RepID=A0A942USP1_9FIRM|nr:M23 family metallopeptidase [Anaeromonas frigoriresistens]MBS4538499.1 peptidoglycan DD-metalloendopeptidase family protein [Anaeromonas frigoriresistens]